MKVFRVSALCFAFWLQSASCRWFRNFLDIYGCRYYELMRGTNEILASNYDIAKGQTRALWDRHLGFSQFCRLLFRLKVFRIQTLSTVMGQFKGSYFGVGVASRHFWPNWSIAANGATHVFHNSWVLFHLLQGETERFHNLWVLFHLLQGRLLATRTLLKKLSFKSRLLGGD